jgi:hypothetical protein
MSRVPIVLKFGAMRLITDSRLADNLLMMLPLPTQFEYNE